MGSSRRATVAIAVTAAIVAPSLTSAQQPAFHPGLGDLMTAFVQPCHTKLGLAGSEKNWPYAAYELKELREPSTMSQRSCRSIGIVGPRDDRIDSQAAAGGTRLGDQGTGRLSVHCGLWTTDSFVQRLPSEHRSCGDRDPAAGEHRLSGSGFPSACEMINILWPDAAIQSTAANYQTCQPSVSGKHNLQDARRFIKGFTDDFIST